jgi:hypothetical protein
MPIPYVGRRFTPKEFEKYLSEVKFTGFKPQFVTLHHTAIPSLAQRIEGFEDLHLKNLLSYYQDQLGWTGAPHVFIDDREDGIIVFQRLDKKGVHARSFNSISWGIEMLGNYDSEAFDAGRGAKVRDLSMQCLAMMCKRLGVKAETIRFHRDDPKTNKTCPGTKVTKIDVVARVANLMKQPVAEETGSEDRAEWSVFFPSGIELKPVHSKDGRPIVKLRDVVNVLSPGGTFSLLSGGLQEKWTSKKGKASFIGVAQIDEVGKSWAFLRDVTDATGLSLVVKGKRIDLKF